MLGVQRLEAREWRRQAWHIAPGFLPFILWLAPHHDPLSVLELSLILVLVVLLCGGFLCQRKRLAREGENNLLNPMLAYAAVFLLPLFLFPTRAELAMTVVSIVAFGDGAATIGGSLLRGRKLFWNRRKTWSGIVSFVLVGWPLATLTYWGEARPAVPLLISGAATGLTVLLAAIAESLNSRIDDNLRVGLTSLAILVPLSLLATPLPRAG